MRLETRECILYKNWERILRAVFGDRVS